MTPEKTKEKIFAGSGTGSREDLFRELYEICFPTVAAFVASRGGSFDDARDIFHDSLIDFYERSRDESFAIRGSAPAYLHGIARNKWYRYFAKQKGHVSADQTDSPGFLEEPEVPDPDQAKLLMVLQRAGARCVELLEMFYYHGLSAKSIAKKKGYLNEHVATVQKYKCLEKVREFVKRKSMSYGDFLA